MTALVQLEDLVGVIWVNPLQVLTVLTDIELNEVLIHMPDGYRVHLPVPEGSTLDGHTRMVVGKLNTGLVAEFK